MTRKVNKKKIIALAAAGVLVLGAAGAAFTSCGKGKRTARAENNIRSYTVQTGDIQKTVSGTGVLEAAQKLDLDLLSLVKVDSVYVKAGDSVKTDDPLATVDAVSVMSAIETVRDKLEELDEDIEDARDDTVSTSVKAGVAGRVKKILVSKGSDVSDVMKEEGALMLLSLDGKMKTVFASGADVSVGDDVTVVLSDGTKKEASVSAKVGQQVTVTLTDDGPAYGDKVTVQKGETTLGTGELAINSEMKVAGFTGTVSEIKVSANEKVSAGTVVLKLKNMPKTPEYEQLVQQRNELADTLRQLSALYKDPNLYSPYDGYILRVNCGDAQEVELLEAEAITENTQQAAPAEEGNTPAAATQLSGGFKAMSYVKSMTAAGNAGGMAYMSAQTSETPEASNTPESSQTPETSETPESSDIPEPSDPQPAVDTPITSIAAIEIKAPKTGEKIPAQLSIASGAPVSGSISWSPAAGDGIFAGGTAYTATVSLTAKDGYSFDKNSLTAGNAMISNGDGMNKVSTLTVSDDGKKLTFTVTYEATQAALNQQSQGNQAATPAAGNNGANNNAAGAAPAAGGFSFKGGSVRSASGGYSFSQASSSAGTGEEQTAAADDPAAVTAVFTIASQERVSVEMTVDELDILSLKEGQKAMITVDAAGTTAYEGTVTEVNTVSDSSEEGVTKYTATIEMDKTEELLAGMNASVSVVISSAENVITIPEAALNEKGNTVAVYTSYDEKTQTLGGEKEIVCGSSDGTNVEILEGLSDGDTLYYEYKASDNENMPFGNFGGDMPGGFGGDMPGGMGQGGPSGNPPSGGQSRGFGK